jgi:hypothetical protein
MADPKHVPEPWRSFKICRPGQPSHSFNRTSEPRAESPNGGEPNVLIYVGCEGGSCRYFDVLAMFDEADWAE